MKLLYKNQKSKIIITIFCVLTLPVYSQTREHNFYLNFYHTFKYPQALRDSCKAVYTNLLIDVNEDGKIVDMQLSDTSPQVLIDRLNAVKNDLKPQLLDSTIQVNQLKNCGILIPLFFVFEDHYCTNSFERERLIIQNYLTFNGKLYNKLVKPMPPIIFKAFKLRY